MDSFNNDRNFYVRFLKFVPYEHRIFILLEICIFENKKTIKWNLIKY